MKPLTEYERWAIEERELTGEAAEDERRIREAIAIDEAAFAAATARQEAWDLFGVDGDEFPHMSHTMKQWLDDAGQ